jgi:hypothetical protein
MLLRKATIKQKDALVPRRRPAEPLFGIGGILPPQPTLSHGRVGPSSEAALSFVSARIAPSFPQGPVLRQPGRPAQSFLSAQGTSPHRVGSRRSSDQSATTSRYPAS